MLRFDARCSLGGVGATGDSMVRGRVRAASEGGSISMGDAVSDRVGVSQGLAGFWASPTQERPKSVSLMCPVLSMRTLSGLISRWHTPSSSWRYLKDSNEGVGHSVSYNVRSQNQIWV